MTAESPEYQNSVNHTVEGDTVKVDLYDANKGKAPRTGGPYRDEIEAEQAELMRAKAEGRDPDFDNPGPYAGTQLVPASQLTETDVDKRHFADTVKLENEPVVSVEVQQPVYEADPAQADWDNDTSKLDALRAGTEYNDLVAKNNTPDPEPKDQDFLTTEDNDNV